MIENLGIYFPNLIATLLGSVALTLLGAHLNARGEALQAMLVSQASGLGVSIALALGLLVGESVSHNTLTPIIGAILFAGLSYAASQFLTKKWRSKANTLLLSFFVLSLSLNYVVTAAFPALEAHFASTFLGDIATASSHSSWYFSALAAVSLGILTAFWKSFLLNSFWATSADMCLSRKIEILFYVLAAVLVIESTRIFGFLVTISSLVTLPLCVSLVARNLKYFSLILVACSLVSIQLAFMISMANERLPTSALIALSQAFIGGLLVFLHTLKVKLVRNAND